jgi:hypothetical protein
MKLQYLRERLGSLRSTAVCWDGRLMFVAVAKSAEVIEVVAEANRNYAVLRPVVTAIP